MRLSRGEHELQRAFDRVERDLLIFSRRLFQFRKESEYLRASLHELGDFCTLMHKGRDLEEIRSEREEMDGVVTDTKDPKNSAPLPVKSPNGG